VRRAGNPVPVMVELDVAFAAVSILAVVTVAFLLRACSRGTTPVRQREELGRQTAVADVVVVDIQAGLDDAACPRWCTPRRPWWSARRSPLLRLVQPRRHAARSVSASTAAGTCSGCCRIARTPSTSCASTSGCGGARRAPSAARRRCPDLP
jgi:hypothetical protein